MQIAETIVMVLHIIASLVLIVVVLLQSGKAAGLSGTIAGGEMCIRDRYKPLGSVGIRSKDSVEASVERSDICAVPACGVVCEAVVAFEIAKAVLEKFGADSLAELKRNYLAYQADVKSR